jgi:hypothetical protein
VFEVKFKSDETLPSRSLLPAIVKESGWPCPFGRPVVETRARVTAARSLVVVIRTRCGSG